MSTAPRFSWRAGLQNSVHTFLTAEDCVGSDLNCYSRGLARKQVWTLELNKDETVFLQSHNGRYVTADKYGMVKCDATQHTPEGKFIVNFSPFGSGRWAFKSEKFGNYLGGTENKVTCTARNITEEELWYVQMAMHPQIALGNKRRKRYFSLEENEIRCRNVIPWGPNSIFMLEYHTGKYLIKTPDNRYLHQDGSLVNANVVQTQYTMELRVNPESKLEGIAFRDSEGKYLSGVGAAGNLKSRNTKISDDEIFHLEESPPQIVLECPNGFNATIQAGYELWASSKNMTEKEIFQLVFDRSSSKFSILSNETKYWTLNRSDGLQATTQHVHDKSLLQIEYTGGAVAIMAANRKYLGVRPNGQIVAKSTSIGPNEMFYLRLVNRPYLVLKSEFGFVGKKIPIVTEPEYMCNKSEYEIMRLDYHEKGQYFIKGGNSKYWNISRNNSIVSKGVRPEPFVIELVGHCKIAILAPNEKYINAEKIGILSASMDSKSPSCYWDF